VAAELRVTDHTVGKWRARFIQRGLAGLLHEPRCGAPRRVSDDQVEAVLTQTLETLPRDATHWSTRSLAATRGLSHTTVRRIWNAFGLQPHRVETFKLSNDPQFIAKVRDIVGLYLHPPQQALLLCVAPQPTAASRDRGGHRRRVVSYEGSPRTRRWFAKEDVTEAGAARSSRSCPADSGRPGAP
jgi:transposase